MSRLGRKPYSNYLPTELSVISASLTHNGASETICPIANNNRGVIDSGVIAYDPYAEKLYLTRAEANQAGKLITNRIIYLQDRHGPADDIMQQMEAKGISAIPRERVQRIWDAFFDKNKAFYSRFRPELNPA
jgi:hypothetical protein